MSNTERPSSGPLGSNVFSAYDDRIALVSDDVSQGYLHCREDWRRRSWGPFWRRKKESWRQVLSWDLYLFDQIDLPVSGEFEIGDIESSLAMDRFLYRGREMVVTWLGAEESQEIRRKLNI